MNDPTRDPYSTRLWLLAVPIAIWLGIAIGWSASAEHWYSPIVQHYNDWLTLILSGSVAFFTYLQYRINAGLLRATIVASQATASNLVIQLPRISAVSYRLEMHNNRIRTPINPQSGGGFHCLVEVTLQNKGKSGAALKRFCVNHAVGDRLTGTPDYSNAYDLQIDAALEEGQVRPIPHFFDISAAEENDVLAGRKNLLFYGFIDYVDLTNVLHRQKFSIMFLGGIARRFMAPFAVPPEYIV